MSNDRSRKKFRLEWNILVVTVFAFEWCASGACDVVMEYRMSDDDRREIFAPIPADVQSRIGEKLKAIYQEVVEAPVPDRFAELLAKLGSGEMTVAVTPPAIAIASKSGADTLDIASRPSVTDVSEAASSTINSDRSVGQRQGTSS